MVRICWFARLLATASGNQEDWTNRFLWFSLLILGGLTFLGPKSALADTQHKKTHTSSDATAKREVSSEDAANALAQLPFGIVIGRTQVRDILRRGNCVEGEIPPDPNAGFPVFSAGKKTCTRFNMAGRFEVHLSEAAFVNKIIFANHQGHALPRDWRAVGFTLGVEGKRQGTTHRDFLSLIASANAIRVLAESENDITLGFEIGRNVYEAKFWKQDSSPQPDRDASTWLWRAGLYRLEVTEGY